MVRRHGNGGTEKDADCEHAITWFSIEPQPRSPAFSEKPGFYRRKTGERGLSLGVIPIAVNCRSIAVETPVPEFSQGVNVAA